MTEEQYRTAQNIRGNIQTIADLEYEIVQASAFARLPDDIKRKVSEFMLSLIDEQQKKFGEL